MTTSKDKERYETLQRYFRMAFAGLITLGLAGISYWLAPPAIQKGILPLCLLISFILIFPLLLYGTYLSALYWRDHMPAPQGNTWLFYLILCSVIRINHFGFGFLVGLIFFSKHTFPGYRRIYYQTEA